MNLATYSSKLTVVLGLGLVLAASAFGCVDDDRTGEVDPEGIATTTEARSSPLHETSCTTETLSGAAGTTISSWANLSACPGSSLGEVTARSPNTAPVSYGGSDCPSQWDVEVDDLVSRVDGFRGHVFYDFANDPVPEDATGCPHMKLDYTAFIHRISDGAWVVLASGQASGTWNSFLSTCELGFTTGDFAPG